MPDESHLCSSFALFHSVMYFFLYQLPFSTSCTVFDSVSTNIDKVLSVHSYTKIFACGDFSVHHEDWLTYSGVTDRPGELCCNFSVSHDLTQGLYPGPWLSDSHTWLWYLQFSTCWLFFTLDRPYTLFCKGQLGSCDSFSIHWIYIKLTERCCVSSYSFWLLSCDVFYSYDSEKWCYFTNSFTCLSPS